MVISTVWPSAVSVILIVTRIVVFRLSESASNRLPPFGGTSIQFPMLSDSQ